MRGAILMIALLVGGCAAQRQAEFDMQKRACEMRYPDARTQFVSQQRCEGDALVRAFPDDPLASFNAALRVELAQEVQANRITRDQAALIFARQILAAEQRESAVRERLAEGCGAALAGAAAMERAQQRPLPTSPYPEAEVAPVDALTPMAEWQAIRICEGH